MDNNYVKLTNIYKMYTRPSYQLSIINYQLSIINYQLSIINYQLSINLSEWWESNPHQ